MGADISDVQNESILKELNESINNYKDTVVNKYKVNVQSQQTTLNEINIVLDGVQMGDLNAEQTSYQNALLEVVNACTAALSQSANAVQKNQIKQDLINEAKKEAGLFSLSVSKTANKNETEVANKVKNEFINEITNEINNDFKNIQSLTNRINFSAKNSSLGNVRISQSNTQSQNNSTKNIGDTTIAQSADNTQGNSGTQSSSNKEETKVGLTTGLMAVIAVMVVIVVIFAAKAAVDPNLGKNVSQMKGMAGGFYGVNFDLLGGNSINKTLIFGIIIFIVLIIITIICYKKCIVKSSIEKYIK